MQIIRRYKKLSWFEFVDIISEQLETNPERDIYFELMDELHWRLVESISEGASFKLKAQAQKIIEAFALSVCVTQKDLESLKQMAKGILLEN